jgi:hypothetical protein
MVMGETITLGAMLLIGPSIRDAGSMTGEVFSVVPVE